MGEQSQEADSEVEVVKGEIFKGYWRKSVGGIGRREDWVEEEAEPWAVLTDAEPTR